MTSMAHGSCGWDDRARSQGCNASRLLRIICGGVAPTTVVGAAHLLRLLVPSRCRVVLHSWSWRASAAVQEAAAHAASASGGAAPPHTRLRSKALQRHGQGNKEGEPSDESGLGWCQGKDRDVALLGLQGHWPPGLITGVDRIEVALLSFLPSFFFFWI